MTISDNLETFNGKSIVDFSSTEGVIDPQAAAYRLRLDYEAFDAGKSISHLIESFCQHPKCTTSKGTDHRSI